MRKVTTVATVLGASALIAFGATGTAVAGHLIGSGGIKNDSIRSVDIHDGGVHAEDLGSGLSREIATGNMHDLRGAYYSVASYDVGDTNAGAIATVACSSTTDVAINGGVQVLGLGEGANSRNTPVSSSFPGRMDWSTNAPKPGRLDGWIVQFGGNAGATSDKDPLKTKIWALCVPGANIPVKQTYLESAD